MSKTKSRTAAIAFAVMTLAGRIAAGALLVSSLLAVPAAAAPAQPTIKLASKRAAAEGGGGRCQATVLYPQVSGLSDRRLEPAINRYLELQFRGRDDRELSGAFGSCPSTYMASIGFSAIVLPNGLLSVKKTRAVRRRDRAGHRIQSSCEVVDLRRGQVVAVPSLLGAAGLAKLSQLTQSAIEQRFRSHDLRRAGFAVRAIRLTESNFTACLDDTHITVLIGPSFYDGNERGAVEARIPYAELADATRGAGFPALLP